MDTNDLFAFLDETPTERVNNDTVDTIKDDPSLESNTILQKRKEIAPSSVDWESQQDTKDPDASSPKRARLTPPNPIVLDDFETEARREVAVSGGLNETQGTSSGT